MNETPFQQTISELFTKLEAAVEQRKLAEIQITSTVAAIRALAGMCEDEEEKADYLARLEENSGKPGFKDAVLSVLKTHRAGLTPVEIRSWILMSKKMNLSGYSNALASIHTTLKRLKKSGNVEEIKGKAPGQMVYRLTRPGERG